MEDSLAIIAQYTSLKNYKARFTYKKHNVLNRLPFATMKQINDERGKCQKMTFNCKVEGKETTKFEKILKTKGTNFFPKTVFVWNAIGEGRGREEVNKKL